MLFTFLLLLSSGPPAPCGARGSLPENSFTAPSAAYHRVAVLFGAVLSRVWWIAILPCRFAEARHAPDSESPYPAARRRPYRRGMCGSSRSAAHANSGVVH